MLTFFVAGTVCLAPKRRCLKKLWSRRPLSSSIRNLTFCTSWSPSWTPTSSWTPACRSIERTSTPGSLLSRFPELTTLDSIKGTSFSIFRNLCIKNVFFYLNCEGTTLLRRSTLHQLIGWRWVASAFCTTPSWGGSASSRTTSWSARWRRTPRSWTSPLRRLPTRTCWGWSTRRRSWGRICWIL